MSRAAKWRRFISGDDIIYRVDIAERFILICITAYSLAAYCLMLTLPLPGAAKPSDCRLAHSFLFDTSYYIDDEWARHARVEFKAPP